jgi:hypothetical protein
MNKFSFSFSGLYIFIFSLINVWTRSGDTDRRYLLRRVRGFEPHRFKILGVMFKYFILLSLNYKLF